MNSRLKHNILISGGGTGGHIFPAIAIAQELQVLRRDVHCVFVGALGKMEMEKVPQAGFRIIGLPVTAFHRRITARNLLFPLNLLRSMIRARQIIRRYRPVLVIGTGGFASGPLMKAAARAKVPVVIQEQNAFPGITNRLMAGQADRVCVAHEGLERWFPADKIRFTGNPVRKDLENTDQKRAEALDAFELSGKRPVVLLFGGSLGAQALNDAVGANLQELSAMNIDLIWQTGRGFYPQAEAMIEAQDAGFIRVRPFLERMDLAYAAADVVIARAGAITLSELAIAARPCILVPYPAAAGNHQMKNAQSFEQQGAAMVVENHEIRERLSATLQGLLSDTAKQKNMRQALRKLARPDAGRQIAEEVLQIWNQTVSR